MFTLDEGPVPGCIGRIAELHALHYAASNGFGVPFEAKVARELAAFCEAYVPGRDGLWLARVGGRIEGSIAIDGKNAAAEGAQLRWFITSDALRGQGAGRRLLGAAMAFVDGCGVGTTRLRTFAGLDAARHLYGSWGFELVEERPGNTWGQVVVEQQFRRIVARA